MNDRGYVSTRNWQE